MILENEKAKVIVDILNKKKFEIFYREWNEDFVYNKKTFIYDINASFYYKNNDAVKSISIIIKQDCLEERDYQPLSFAKVFEDKDREESYRIYNREIELERHKYDRDLKDYQTLECIEVDYKNFEYYAQHLSLNKNKNVFIANFIIEVIKKELELDIVIIES